MISYLDESSRVQRSAAFSIGLHGALFGAFVLFKILHPGQKDLMITEVDFVDLSPKAQEETAPEPAQRAPTRMRDFLRLALPALKPSVPQDGPKEMPTPKDIQMPQLPQMKALVDRSDPLSRNAPALNLNERSLSRVPAQNLGEIAPTVSAPPDASIKTIMPDKAIDISAVGRQAVRVAGPAIQINPNAPVSTGRMRDLGAVAPSAPVSAAPAQVREAGITISGEGGPARRGSLGSSSLPIGYGRGSGLTISDKPMIRGGGRQALAPTAPAAAAAVEPAEAAGKKKGGMEISGPLAGRKLVSAQMPAYPEWARAKGVEADVLIRFFVNAEGAVLDRMLIERTSGYKELDDVCMEALKKLVFVPLPTGQTEDQWGIITFRFRLK